MQVLLIIDSYLSDPTIRTVKAMLTQEQKKWCVDLYVNTDLDFDDIAEIVGADEDEVEEYLEGAEPEKRY